MKTDFVVKWRKIFKKEKKKEKTLQSNLFFFARVKSDQRSQLIEPWHHCTEAELSGESDANIASDSAQSKLRDTDIVFLLFYTKTVTQTFEKQPFLIETKTNKYCLYISKKKKIIVENAH